MSPQEIEDIFIRSLDVPVKQDEKENFLKMLNENPALAEQLEDYKKMRELIHADEQATFGPFFAAKVIHKIQNTGVVIDRQIFTFFKKFQLAALGVIVAVLILNVWLADQGTLTSILGLDNNTSGEDYQIASFDFYDTLNK
ncbi:MAG TPA: hypothetical protein VIM65_07210 [Cyclobacteriaceae bacterium]